MWTMQQIFDGLKNGTLTQTQAWEAFWELQSSVGKTDTEIAGSWDSFRSAALNQGTMPMSMTNGAQGPAVTPPAGTTEKAFQEFNPQAAYRKNYNIPGQGASDFQGWLSRQFEPTYGTYKAQRYLSPAGTTDPGFGSYMTGGTGDPFNSRKQAANLFGQAANLRGQGELSQQSFQNRLGEDFQAFMQNVLKNRYGADLANNMGNDLGALQQQYQGQTSGQGGDFLSFLKQQFRL